MHALEVSFICLLAGNSSFSVCHSTCFLYLGFQLSYHFLGNDYFSCHLSELPTVFGLHFSHGRWHLSLLHACCVSSLWLTLASAEAGVWCHDTATSCCALTASNLNDQFYFQEFLSRACKHCLPHILLILPSRVLSSRPLHHPNFSLAPACFRAFIALGGKFSDLFRSIFQVNNTQSPCLTSCLVSPQAS